MPHTSQTLLCALLPLVSLTTAVSAKGTLSIDLQKRAVVNGRAVAARGLYRRQDSNAGTVESTVYDVLPWSTGGAYYTNITVGTPPQTLTVILDTGSSDLYVDAASAPACRDTSSANSCRGGSFDPGASSSYQVVQQGAFDTSFGDGSTANGDFGSDVVGIGDVVLTGVQFGVATNVTSTVGYAVSLVGIGYTPIEAGSVKYPNMPELLRDSGAINSRLYSVFLNDQGDASGTILFGGVDTSKYTGALHTLDLLPNSGQDPNTGDRVSLVEQFIVSVTGLKINANGKTNTVLEGGDPTGQDSRNSLAVLLDTGSSAWTVPETWFEDIVSAFGDAIDRNGNLLCSHQNDQVSLDVEFGGQVTVNVPAKSFISPIFDQTSNQAITDKNGNPYCVLGIVPDSGNTQLRSSGFTTLGDAVLRSMYVVFDLDNGQVSIAPANFGAATDASSSGSGDNVKVVQAGASGVAQAVGSANSGVSTAAPNSYSVPAVLTPSQSLSFATASSAVGTATGTDAPPLDGRVASTASGSGGSSGSGSSVSPTSSKGAAAPSTLGPFEFAGPVVCAIWVAMGTLGIAIVL